MFFPWQKGRALDERYLLHRYKSTSHAGVVGGLALCGYFLYGQFAHDVLRYEFLAIAGLMALVKIVCLIWFSRRA